MVFQDTRSGWIGKRLILWLLRPLFLADVEGELSLSTAQARPPPCVHLTMALQGQGLVLSPGRGGGGWRERRAEAPLEKSFPYG